MKKILAVLVALLLSLSLWALAPQKLTRGWAITPITHATAGLPNTIAPDP